MVAVLLGPLLSCGGSGCQPKDEPSAVAPAPPSSAVADRWHYTVRPTRALDRLDVGLCFFGPAPAALVVDGSDVAAAVSSIQTADGRALAVDEQSETIDLLGVGADTCISYTVDIDEVLQQVSNRRASRVGEHVVLTVGTWLWRPQKLPKAPQITLAWDLPEGIHVSHPWASAADNDAIAHTQKVTGPVVSLPRTTFRWRSQVALGTFEVEQIEAAGSTFSIAALGSTALSREGRKRWVTTAAETVARLYGTFPVPRAQIMVIPSGGGDTPVYFGLTSRGGGGSVAALVSTDADDAAFVGEWVLIHEFLHLGMPFVRGRDVWLSEGFVTYYTAVLRTRAGFRSEAEAWRSILAGLGRGSRSARGQTLAEASATMHEQHAYDRIYWGGAAIALLLDVTLRNQGKPSLDAAMKQLQQCCADSPRQWSASEVLAVFDEFFGTDEVSTICAGELGRSTFTDLAQTLEQLGVSERDGEVVLDADTAKAALRAAVVGG